MRRSIDDATDDAPLDEDRVRVSWALAVSDDYEDAVARVVLTLEELGAAGEGVVAHLGPDLARRLRLALRDGLREIGEDPGS